jgi:hypothetical protein
MPKRHAERSDRENPMDDATATATANPIRTFGNGKGREVRGIVSIERFKVPARKNDPARETFRLVGPFILYRNGEKVDKRGSLTLTAEETTALLESAGVTLADSGRIVSALNDAARRANGAKRAFIVRLPAVDASAFDAAAILADAEAFDPTATAEETTPDPEG